jgi:hypothetical protein
MTQPNYVLEGIQSSLAHHWSEFFLEIRHQFHTSILLSNWILTNQQTSIWNLWSDVYFEYTPCYFKVVTLFVRNFFRVRLLYLKSKSISQYILFSLGMFTYTYERQNIKQIALKRLPGGGERRKKKDLFVVITLLIIHC